MKFIDFIKGKILTISLIILAICTIEIFLLVYDVGLILKVYIPIIILFVYFIGLIIEFNNKKEYYNKLLLNLKELEQKYLITEVIEKPDFIEGKIFYEALQEVDKSMCENVNKYKYIQEEYKEYIELWIHEIKIPIATSKLIIENNKNQITKNIDEEINKIDDYIEQALFYARSNMIEKDYMIRKTNLKDIINSVIKKNKSQLISKKIKIEIKDIDEYVYTDSKWINFILNQIIINSIKYSKLDNPTIKIASRKLKENVILYIRDNGIGVKKGEITRVFEKGFTGTNGRIIGKKSTGLGLYLCKKMCDKLNIGIEFNSVEGIETEVKIIFPINSHIEEYR